MKDDFDNLGLPDDELAGEHSGEMGERGLGSAEGEMEPMAPASRRTGGARARKSSGGRKASGSSRKAAGKKKTGATKKAGVKKAAKKKAAKKSTKKAGAKKSGAKKSGRAKRKGGRR